MNVEIVNNVIFLILLLAGCVASACLVCFAIPDLKWEKGALSCFISRFKDDKKKVEDRRKLWTEQHPDGNAEEDAYLDFMDLHGRVSTDGRIRHYHDSSEVHEEAVLGKREGTETRRRSYIADRLYVILCAASTANLVRKVPPLTDLHELTQQQERGKWPTALFRALTPAMLVIGILGTLIGVHLQLARPDFMAKGTIQQLGIALAPGIMAVLCTIVCIILRGWYNKRYAAFTSKLDQFTLESLLPFFRLKGEIQEDAQTFSRNMENITALNFENWGRKLGDYMEAVEKCRCACTSLPATCGKAIGKLAELENCCLNNLQLLKQRGAELDSNHGSLCNLARRLAHHSHQTATQLSSIPAPLQQTAEQAAHLAIMAQNRGPELDAAWQRIYTGSITARADIARMAVPYSADFGKGSDDFRDWLQSGLGTAEQGYADAAAPTRKLLDNMAAQVQTVKLNTAFIRKGCESLETAAQNLKPLITGIREQRCGMWKSAAASLDKWRERYGREWLDSENESLYPKGWEGIKMRTRDLLDRCRRFLYGGVPGWVCCFVFFAGLGAFLYWG